MELSLNQNYCALNMRFNTFTDPNHFQPTITRKGGLKTSLKVNENQVDPHAGLYPVLAR